MKKQYTKYLFYSLWLLSSCSNENKKETHEVVDFPSVNNKQYLKYKSAFDEELVTHFPKQLESEETFVVSNTNADENNVGLILYEYNLTITQVDSLQRKINDIGVAAKYKSSDPCLLIVKPNELDSSKNFTHKGNEKCAEDLLPVPYFFDYSLPNKNNNLNIDTSFYLYVFEATNEMRYEKFQMKPYVQMSQNWKNGGSRGIAISRQNQTVIYWGILW